MKTVFSAAMRHATKLTRAQNVIEATRVIQRALSGRGRDFSPDQQTSESPRLITPPTNGAESADAFEQPQEDAGIARPHFRASTAEQRPAGRMKRPLGGLDAVASSQSSQLRPRSRAVREIAQSAVGAHSARGGLSHENLHLRGGVQRLQGLRPQPRGRPDASFGYHAPRLHSEPRRLRGGDWHEPALRRARLHRRLSEATDARQSIGMLELVQYEGPDARCGGTQHYRRDYARDHGGFQYRRQAGLCGGPFGRGRHGRDHERHLSRALRRDRRSLRPRSWVRHRRGFGIRRHARRTGFRGVGARKLVARGRMITSALLFFMACRIKRYTRRTPK